MTEFILDQNQKRIVSLIGKASIKIRIPDYLSHSYVTDILGDATILWQSDNEHNFCVLYTYIDESYPFSSLFYFSRFFTISNTTVVSHDANGNDFLKMILSLSEATNKRFQ